MDESKTPLGTIVPLSNFVPRGFGFVHHSIAILDHQVPNLSLTIRNFCIAVAHPPSGHVHAILLDPGGRRRAGERPHTAIKKLRIVRLRFGTP
jgi:hypothetical protein